MFNLILLILILTLTNVYLNKANTSFNGDKEVFWKYYFYYAITTIASMTVEFYVDLFLLFLLYRFMRPKKVLKNGMTEACALFFAHDSKRAKQMFLDWNTEEDKGWERYFEKKREFNAFLSNDWASNISTELAVTLEFVNKDERDSLSSSICYFAKSEEISELMEDAYPHSEYDHISERGVDAIPLATNESFIND